MPQSQNVRVLSDACNTIQPSMHVSHTYNPHAPIPSAAHMPDIPSRPIKIHQLDAGKPYTYLTREAL